MLNTEEQQSEDQKSQDEEQLKKLYSEHDEAS